MTLRHRRRHSRAIPLCLLAIGCATTPRPAPPRTAMPVAVSSMRGAYGIQFDLEGTVALRDDWLHVVAPHGSVRTYQGRAEAWDLLLRARLATCTEEGDWQVLSESAAGRMASLVGLTRDSSMLDTTTRVFLDTLRLRLAVPPGTDLERSWVAFELAWPVESVLATYTVHTGVPLMPVGTPLRRARSAGSDAPPGA